MMDADGVEAKVIHVFRLIIVPMRAVENNK